jgi:hypothetical protein
MPSLMGRKCELSKKIGNGAAAPAMDVKFVDPGRLALLTHLNEAERPSTIIIFFQGGAENFDKSQFFVLS